MEDINPYSVRGMFGTDDIRNAVHGSDSQEAMEKETKFWFGGDAKTRPMQTTATLENCTLCIIKPHIVNSG